MMPDPDAPLRRTLFRHKVIATALLGLMAVAAAIGYALPAGPWVGLLRDAGKAGLIGGVADWFAVTALFRHPLGLPIPHTAILPAQKARLGAALGRFVANHVFTAADIDRLLASLDLPSLLGRLLSDNATMRPAATALAGMLPKLLASIEDGRARGLIGRLLPRLAAGRTAGLVIARALQGLVETGRHQEVLTFAIGQLKETLLARQEAIHDAIRDRVREQGGKLMGWAVGASVATRVLAAVTAELERIEPEESELRDAFDEWARREIAKLEHDPERAAQLGRSLRQVLAQDSVKAWAWDIWSRLRHALEIDAVRPNGRSVAVIEGSFTRLGAIFSSDAGAKARLETAVHGLAHQFLPSAQVELANFIGKVIGDWDTATITEKLELRVGKDLQYIRINGTLVGCVLGAAIYGILILAHR